MSAKVKERPKDLAVQVLRWDDGTLYSQVVDRNAGAYEPHRFVVVDRQKGRHIDVNTVKTRARALATLLNIPYEENFDWPCVANQKLPCRCPECIKRGNA